MKTLKMLFVIIGIILFLLFAAPLAFAGILNAGNGMGILFSGLLIYYGVFTEKTNISIKKMWNKKSGKVFLSIITFLILTVIVFVILSTVKIVLAANNTPNEETTVVVLGCQVHPEGPSLMLEERLIAAYEYLSKNENVKCILSGGQGDDEVMSEAECMYNWLIEKGIEAERLYIEDKSTSTRENLLFSKQIIKENNLCPKITIITNDFHQYRAGKIADSLGIEHYSISGGTHPILLPTYYVRELGGILYEMI